MVAHDNQDESRSSLLRDNSSFVKIDSSLVPSHSTLLRHNSTDSLIGQNPFGDDDQIGTVQQTIFNIVYTRGYLLFFIFLFLVQLALIIYSIIQFVTTHDRFHEPLWVIITDSILVFFSVVDLIMRMCAIGVSLFFPFGSISLF